MPREISFFISYARENSALARELALTLKNLGAEVRLDVEELRVGDDYVARLSAAVLAADFLVPIISEAWHRSRWCPQELSLAMAKQLQRDDRARVLPWQLGDAALPPTLAATNCPRIDPADLRGMARVLIDDATEHLRGRGACSVSAEVARRFLEATLTIVGPPPAPERVAVGTGSSPSQMEFMKARDEMRKALRNSAS